MRCFLPLAVLCCLLAAQLATSTRDTFAKDRALLAQPAAKPNAIDVPLNRTQFVQATWALQDITCEGVAAKDATFNNSLAIAVLADITAALIRNGREAATQWLKAKSQPCHDIEYEGRSYASFRVGARYNNTNNTRVRDDMWIAVASVAFAKPCSGGYNKIAFSNVAALFAKYSLTASQNNGSRLNYNGAIGFVDYSGPCVVYPPGANCHNSWIGSCPAGTRPAPKGVIAGVAYNSTEAQDLCCIGSIVPVSPSPSPGPCVPSCGNTTVGKGDPCGDTPNGCNGSCFATCKSASLPGLTCEAGTCKCTPNCSESTSGNVALGQRCGERQDGCNGTCVFTCAAGLSCDATSNTCQCRPTCIGPITVGIDESCAPVNDNCGGSCARNCNDNTVCNANNCVCKPNICTDIINVAAGGACGQVTDPCTGQSCVRSCDANSDCVGGVCLAKQGVINVDRIAIPPGTIPQGRAGQWTTTYQLSASSQLICGQIVPLDITQLNVANPNITSAVTAGSSVAPTPAPMTHGLKFRTVVNDDECSITVAFPGNAPQEAEGMFGGMLWNDFITTKGGTFTYNWYKSQWSGESVDSAPTLRVILVDPDTFSGQLASSVYMTIVFEPVYQNARVKTPPTLDQNGCCVDDFADFANKWVQETITYKIGGSWVESGSQGFTGGNGLCDLFPTLEWYMQVPGINGRQTTGLADCKAGFFWDPSKQHEGFMNRAVMYGLNVAQGSYAKQVVGYVGSVRAYTTSGSPTYDYTWVFK